MENVCGSGKERTVNARPHLLTPKSVSKLYKSDKKNRTRYSHKGRTIYREPLLASLPNIYSEDLQNALNPIAISPVSSLTRNDSFMSDISSEIPLTDTASISGSEISLMSYDDNSDACSLISNTTDLLSINGENFTIGEYPLTDQWIQNQRLYGLKNGEPESEVGSVVSDDASSIGFDSVSDVAVSPVAKEIVSPYSSQRLKISSSFEMPVTSVPSSPIYVQEHSKASQHGENGMVRKL